MSLVAKRITDGTFVAPGDEVTSFRGQKAEFGRATRPNSPNKDGKVLVNGQEFYARVWGLTVADEGEAALVPA